MKTEQIRLNKALSQLGIASRREADRLIEKGLIKVNGEVAKTLGFRVSFGDLILFEGKKYVLKKMPSSSTLWLYYKKVGEITTHKDPEGRMTVFEAVKDRIKKRVISVGRLDINSEGLILLTDDSSFAHKAENPKTGWERVYKVRVFGELPSSAIQEIQKGVTIDSIHYGPIYVKKLSGSGTNSWYECALSEGKNREIRKIFKHYGLLVNRLIRIKYGPYELKDLKPGELKLLGLPPNL